MEHGPIDLQAAHAMITATSGTAAVPLVRTAAQEAWQAKALMDLGVLGVCFPMVCNRAQAEAAVRAVRYPPVGDRLWGPFYAPMRGGMQMSEYIDAANEAVLSIVTIEHPEAVRNIDEIASVPGLDLAVIGPGDLAMAMGIPGQFDHPKFKAAVAEAESRRLQSQVALCGVARTPDQARAMLDRALRDHHVRLRLDAPEAWHGTLHRGGALLINGTGCPNGARRRPRPLQFPRQSTSGRRHSIRSCRSPKEAMSARIQPASAPFDREVAEVIDRTMKGQPPLHLFATLARDPRLARKFFAGGLLDKGNLTVRQREIVIDRTTALCRSEYEWGLHVAVYAAKAGLTEEQVRSTVSGSADDPCWTSEDRSLIRLCDRLHRHCDIDDELWSALRTAFTENAILELLLLAGFYRTVSYLTNGLRLPLESVGARFPGGQI